MDSPLRAYVLIQASSSGADRRLAQQVAAVERIVIAEAVSGPYDVIARAEVSSHEQLHEVVAAILGIDGVIRVLACPSSTLSASPAAA
jgi:DNA-binding Lrp family transcriptional regulator